MSNIAAFTQEQRSAKGGSFVSDFADLHLPYDACCRKDRCALTSFISQMSPHETLQGIHRKMSPLPLCGDYVVADVRAKGAVVVGICGTLSCCNFLHH